MHQSVTEVIENGSKLVAFMRADENGRYRSWEHCYSAFAGHKDKTFSEEDLDFLCLHLSFYLASWGMYRGSSFLLQKDYRVHATAIKELLNPDYIDLWAVKCEDYTHNHIKLQKLFSLSNALKEIYSGIRISANEAINCEIPAQPISDILITKILMGTLGCVPAYDRYFKEGVKKYGVAAALFTSRSIHNLSKYYVENSDDFESWRRTISCEGLEYPQMKVLDMCFWQLGHNLDLNNQ